MPLPQSLLTPQLGGRCSLRQGLRHAIPLLGTVRRPASPFKYFPELLHSFAPAVALPQCLFFMSMNYHLLIASHHRRHLSIRLSVPPSAAETLFRLPRWRPGRYEMMDYANNLFEMSASDPSGKPADLERVGTHEWVLAPHPQAVVLEYKYYASVLDAGRSYVDDQQLYVNPCNLFLYTNESVNEPCSLTLELPQGWELAVGLPRTGNTLHAANFHELADSPFFASPSLQKISYNIEGIPFHCWFQGAVKPPVERVTSEFRAFSQAQGQLFGGFPFKEYHFLFQFVEEKFHHGVEHQNNTVIVLGPGRRLKTNAVYNDFLGISSHELFHAWNVKAIRPAEMQPYDYGVAQYSKLHYVTEGVTTYYGDLMLLKSGVWDLNTWLNSFNAGELGRYYANDGRHYVSLEQSSMESWTVGYAPGVPNRKISFYSKGAIVSFILDIQIMQATGNQKGLDEVMRLLYERFGKTGTGYTREDYLGLVNEVSGQDFVSFFEAYVSGTAPVEQPLRTAAQYVGLQLVQDKPGEPCLEMLGILLDEDLPGNPIRLVFEGSAADEAGFSVGDILLTVNGLRATGNRLDELLVHFAGEDAVEIAFQRGGRLRSTRASLRSDWRNPSQQLVVDPSPSAEQTENQRLWMSLPA
jgi:predicted metalloprotease with PDZ domain